MKVFNLNSNDRFLSSSTSKGNQLKWYKDGYYIKADTMGYESISEVLVSELFHYIKGIKRVLMSRLKKSEGKLWIRP